MDSNQCHWGRRQGLKYVFKKDILWKQRMRQRTESVESARFSSKLYRQIVGIPMGTNCAPLVADLFLFCYERDFMLSLSDNNQTDIIEAFNSTSRY